MILASNVLSLISYLALYGDILLVSSLKRSVKLEGEYGAQLEGEYGAQLAGEYGAQLAGEYIQYIC